MFSIPFASILLQLWLAALALAAPAADVAAQGHHGNVWQYGTGGGIIGLIVLIVDIIIFVEVLKSNRSGMSKLIWCLVVFIFPIFGMVIYWLFSNRQEHNRGAGYEPLS